MGSYCLAQILAFCIGHDADNGIPTFVPSKCRYAEASSDRTRAAEDVMRHTLVDDRHLGCVGTIVAGKIAPQQDRRLKGFEVVGPQGIQAGDEGRAARSWLIALNRWRGFAETARKRRIHGKARSPYSGKSVYLIG